MSLLIKALDKAQEAKAQEAKAQEKKVRDANAEPAVKRKPQILDNDVTQSSVNSTTAKIAAANALEMELSPIAQAKNNAPQSYTPSQSYDTKVQENADAFEITSTFKLQQPTPSASKSNKVSSSVKASTANKDSAISAANVFAAKRIESNNQNAILALVAAISLCLLLAAGGYYYLSIEDEPDFVLAKRPALSPVPLSANPEPNVQAIHESQANLQAVNIESGQSGITQKSQSASLPIALVNESASQQLEQVENSVNKPAKASNFRDESLAQNEVVLNDMLVEKTTGERVTSSARGVPKTLEAGAIASRSASIQVSKTQPELGVNPILMDAFNAYNAGNDTVASKLYRQVLQRDVRNVDALLGLGAIAQRQGRIADANGWYGKVLEVEPRNALANTAILDNQPQNDVANNESRIKSMLAKYPDDANLYATLGNFYADLNQWPAAQQAYFDAYRLNASADNAFNLAIALDQLGKPKLALPYYQSALQLAQTGGSNIDKNALEARIAAIR